MQNILAGAIGIAITLVTIIGTAQSTVLFPDFQVFEFCDTNCTGFSGFGGHFELVNRTTNFSIVRFDVTDPAVTSANSTRAFWLGDAIANPGNIAYADKLFILQPSTGGTNPLGPGSSDSSFFFTNSSNTLPASFTVFAVGENGIVSCTASVNAGCDVLGTSAPAPLFSDSYKTSERILSVEFAAVSDGLGILSLITDGKKQLLVDAALFLAQKEAALLNDTTSADTLDVISQLKNVTDAILHFAQTVKSPDSFVLSTLSSLASEDARLAVLAANDPPDSNFTTVMNPPDFSSGDISGLPVLPIFKTTISDMQTCTGLWDAELIANERYQGAILAGDFVSSQLQQQAFNLFHANGLTCANNLANDLLSLKSNMTDLTLTAFLDPIAEISGAISAQCGAPLPTELQDALALSGASSSKIASDICQLAAGFDPTLVTTNIAYTLDPLITGLRDLANDGVAVDEPSTLVLLLTFGGLMVIVVRYRDLDSLGSRSEKC